MQAALAGATVRERVANAVEYIRPAVQMDGGDIVLVDVDESAGVARVQLQGACVGCGHSTVTLVMGVERTIKELVPEIRAVEAV